MKKLLILLILSLLLVAGAYALSVDSVNVDTVSPGEEGTIKINVDNDGNNNVKDLSFTLKFPNDSNIIPVGSSEGFVDEIKENDDETFAFRFKVSNNLAAGTYSLPYTINYREDNSDRTQTGVIGIVVSAEPEIEISADAQNPILGQQGRLNVRIVNKGLADARFVYLFLESEDLTLLSDKSEYVGTVDSDDFETSSFDVIYNDRFATLIAKVTYRDFNNEERLIIENIPIRVYSQEEAIKKGILKRSNTTIYVGIIVGLLVIWIVYRFIRKRQKNKKE